MSCRSIVTPYACVWAGCTWNDDNLYCDTTLSHKIWFWLSWTVIPVLILIVLLCCCCYSSKRTHRLNHSRREIVNSPPCRQQCLQPQTIQAQPAKIIQVVPCQPPPLSPFCNQPANQQGAQYPALSQAPYQPQPPHPQYVHQYGQPYHTMYPPPPPITTIGNPQPITHSQVPQQKLSQQQQVAFSPSSQLPFSPTSSERPPGASAAASLTPSSQLTDASHGTKQSTENRRLVDQIEEEKKKNRELEDRVYWLDQALRQKEEATTSTGHSSMK